MYLWILKYTYKIFGWCFNNTSTFMSFYYYQHCITLPPSYIPPKKRHTHHPESPPKKNKKYVAPTKVMSSFGSQKKTAQGLLTWCRVHCPSLVGSFVGIGEDRPTEHWSRTLSAWCGSKTFGWGRGRCWGGWGIGSNQDKLRVWWKLWGFASNLMATSWITSLHPSWNMRSFTFLWY